MKRKQQDAQEISWALVPPKAGADAGLALISCLFWQNDSNFWNLGFLIYKWDKKILLVLYKRLNEIVYIFKGLGVPQGSDK